MIRMREPKARRKRMGRLECGDRQAAKPSTPRHAARPTGTDEREERENKENEEDDRNEWPNLALPG